MNTKLFELLQKNSAQSISKLTDIKTFQRGREYFTAKSIASFSWEKEDDGRLTVFVKGSKLYRVSFFLLNETLRYLCTCPAWQMDYVCKHVICALLAAREEIPAPSPSEQALPKLITANMKNNTLITIHLYAMSRNHPSNTAFRIEFMRGTTKLTQEDFNLFSIERALCAPHTLVGAESQLVQVLNEKKSTYGITIHTADGPLDVTWNKVDWLTGITELNLVDDTITVRKIGANQQGVQFTQLLRIGSELVVDLTTKHLLTVDPTFAWRWAEYVLFDLRINPDTTFKYKDGIEPKKSYFELVSNPFELKNEYFNGYYPLAYPEKSFDAFASLFIIKEDSKLVVPAQQNLSFVINGTIDTLQESIRLELHARLDGEDIKVYNQLVENIKLIDHLPAWLRTKKRRTIILKTLFALSGDTTSEAHKTILKDGVKELRDSAVGKKRTAEIKNYFTEFLKILNTPAKEMIVANNNTFKRFVLNHSSLWSTLRLIASACTEDSFDTHTEKPSFEIPIEHFYTQLIELKKLLDAHGIELQMNNKRLETMTLDVTVDASSRSEGSEWFSIDPRIMADGIMLSDKQREVLFSNDGNLIETADCIRILDPQSQEIIKMLARMFMLKGESNKIQDKNSIVQIPRLRVLDLLDLRQSGAKVKLAKDDEELLTRLSNFEKIEKIPVPKLFVGSLREYQKDGYRWLAFLYKNRFGACLADDMGLGKTIQTIAFLGSIAEGIIENRSPADTPHLIVVPPTLVFNWQHELKTFYPTLRVMSYTGTADHKKFNLFDVVITTYDRVRIDIEMLEKIQFHVLILDEAQAIKNIAAERTAAIRKLKSIFTISLTGTPLENHLGEYHSIIDVAIPGLLPSYKLFMKCVQEGTHDNFIKKTRPFVLRRTKDAILKDLPEKTESNVFLEMAQKQQKMYATTVAEVKRLIDQAYEMKSAGQASIIALTAILRLRQICISPQMIDMSKESESPKIDYLMNTLETIVQEGKAALIFSQFTTCLDLIEQALKKANIAHYRIDGKTSMVTRRKIVESFQAGDTNVSVLLLSLKTGGVGLNLTRANHVFHIDPWWNPAVENQASDRSHRIGQKNKVFVTRLVMHHTIEEKMMTLKEAKKKLFTEIMEQAENKTKSIITKRDFDLLLS